MDTFPAITDFLTQIIKEKHGTDLPEAMTEQMRQDLLPRLNQWILLKAMTEIASKSPQKLQELEKLAQGDTDPAVVQKFIEDTIPDFQAFLTQTLVSFRQTYQEG